MEPLLVRRAIGNHVFVQRVVKSLFFRRKVIPVQKMTGEMTNIDGTMEVLPNYLVTPQELRITTFTMTVKMDIQKTFKGIPIN